MEAPYTYDNEGKMVSVSYPGDSQTSEAGRKYTDKFDSLARQNKLIDDQPTPVDCVKKERRRNCDRSEESAKSATAKQRACS